MKKLVVTMLAALLALMICMAALAESDASGLYDAAVRLLFRTKNVTLKAKAEFSLDGEWFKTAEGTWMQDGERSFRQLILRSPKWDGTERQNGYTIVMAGNDWSIGNNYYLIEEFNPTYYKSGTATPRDSILRRTIETEQLISLGGALASQADLLLGEGAVTKTAEGDYRIELGENVSVLVNAALNEAARFAAKRYFDIDYDQMAANSEAASFNFRTPTEGLLYTMKSITLRKASATVKTDENGDLQHIEGEIGLFVETVREGIRLLDITFTADVSDAGTTMVKKFNPDDYNVVEYDPASEYGAYDGEPVLPEGDGETLDALIEDATETWPKTGYDLSSLQGNSAYLLSDRYEIYLDGDGITWKSLYNLDGGLMTLETDLKPWQVVDNSEYGYDIQPDPETDKNAKALMMGFIRDVNPALLEFVKDLKAEWTYETDGETFAQYCEYPMDPEGDEGVLFIVKLSPELRIEYYSCESNG